MAQQIEEQLSLNANVKEDNGKYVEVTFNWGNLGTNDLAKKPANEPLKSFKVTLLGDDDEELAVNELDVDLQGGEGRNFRVARTSFYFHRAEKLQAGTPGYGGVWTRGAFLGAENGNPSNEVVKKVKVEIETKHGYIAEIERDGFDLSAN